MLSKKEKLEQKGAEEIADGENAGEETGVMENGSVGADVANGDNVRGFGKLEEELPGAGIGAKVSNGEDEPIVADASNGDEVTDEAPGASEGSAGVVGNGTADSG